MQPKQSVPKQNTVDPYWAAHLQAIQQLASKSADAIAIGTCHTESAQGAHIIFINDAFETLFGRGRDGWLGQPLTVLVQFAAKGSSSMTLLDAFSRQQALDESVLCTDQTGREFSAHVTTVYLTDPLRAATYVVVTIDTTNANMEASAGADTQMNADSGALHATTELENVVTHVTSTDQERVLRLQTDRDIVRQRYDLAAQHAKVGIWDWNVITGDIYLDPSVKALLGYSDDEIPNDLAVWSTYIYEEDTAAVFAAVDAHFAGNTAEYRVQHRMRHKDGSLRWILASGKAMRDSTGQVIRLIGTDIDITDRVELEQARQESQEHLRVIWEVAPDAMLVCDAEGNVAMANQRFFDLFGFARDTCVGRPFTFLFPQDRRKAAIEGYRRVFEREVFPPDITVKLLCSDGREKIVAISATLIRQMGKPTQLLGVLRDITAKTEAEQAAVRHNRLMESLTSISQLLMRPMGSDAERRKRLYAVLVDLRQGAALVSVRLCGLVATPGLPVELIRLELPTRAATISVPEVDATIIAKLAHAQWVVVPNTQVSSDNDAPRLEDEPIGQGSTCFVPVLLHETLWGYLAFTSSTNTWQVYPELQWFTFTAAEMIGNVLLRWQTQALLHDASAILEQQVNQRTSMLYRTVESLQRQIDERRKVEIEVRRRLDIERVLSKISARLVSAHLVGESNFKYAVEATLADIGIRIEAARVCLWEFAPSQTRAKLRQRWSSTSTEFRRNELLDANDIPQLLAHMRKHGFFQVVLPEEVERATDLHVTTAELSAFANCFQDSLLILPLYVLDELAGLLVCCDSKWITHRVSGGVEFVRAAATMLSGMLRIEQVMKTLELRVAEQTRELAAFFNMTVLGSNSENLTSTLALALSMVKEIGTCDAVTVHYCASEKQPLQLVHQVGLMHIEHRHLSQIRPESPFYHRIRLDHGPIFVTETGDMPDEVNLAEFNTYLGTPMIVRGKFQGLLSCYWSATRAVSLNQMSLLTALSDYLGVLLENQRLYRQTQEMAVLNERQRLARDLHDRVTQSLYSMSLFSRASREALMDDDRERLADNLLIVEETAVSSLREMQLLLYELRPVELESQGLIAALSSRLNMVEHRFNIKSDVQMTAPPDMPKVVEDALFHIGMEALNNILKHANASTVTVRLNLQDEYLLMLIADDGVGFIPEADSNGMGLNNMREWAARIAGELEIQSKVKEGTKIWVRIPLEVLIENWS